MNDFPAELKRRKIVRAALREIHAGANAFVRVIDASPRGWVQISRMIVGGGAVPFDPEAAPRFTALYRASGAPAWPRTQAVTPVHSRAVP